MSTSTTTPVPPLLARPTLGYECAAVLFLRGLIAKKDQPRVAEVIGKATGNPQIATEELLRRELILSDDEAEVTEFIKRAVRRFG